MSTRDVVAQSAAISLGEPGTKATVSAWPAMIALAAMPIAPAIPPPPPSHTIDDHRSSRVPRATIIRGPALSSDPYDTNPSTSRTSIETGFAGLQYGFGAQATSAHGDVPRV